MTDKQPSGTVKVRPETYEKLVRLRALRALSSGDFEYLTDILDHAITLALEKAEKEIDVSKVLAQ